MKDKLKMVPITLAAAAIGFIAGIAVAVLTLGCLLGSDEPKQPVRRPTLQEGMKNRQFKPMPKRAPVEKGVATDKS